MKACPRCSLLNPEDGTFCVCGFDLVHGDPASVRGGPRRRGRLYEVIGFLMIGFGLAGGSSWLPIHVGFFINLGSYQMDVSMIAAGGILLAYGARLVERPWSDRVKSSGAG